MLPLHQPDIVKQDAFSFHHLKVKKFAVSILNLAEAVRFELTEHFCSSVFKTGAINQTLPHFLIL